MCFLCACACHQGSVFSDHCGHRMATIADSELFAYGRRCGNTKVRWQLYSAADLKWNPRRSQTLADLSDLNSDGGCNDPCWTEALTLICVQRLETTRAMCQHAASGKITSHGQPPLASVIT